jgi:hypothetical protein
VSNLLLFRLMASASTVPRLWQSEFMTKLSELNLRLDQGTPKECAVTSLDGQSSIWFNTGIKAWDWLRDHDGLMSLWTHDDRGVNFSIQHERSECSPNGMLHAEVDISADLPSSGAMEAKERAVILAESLATAVLDKCELYRGLAYDEDSYERVIELTPVTGATALGLPPWLGYWNAFSLGHYSDELRRVCEQQSVVLELRTSSLIVRLATWPWEAELDGLSQLSHLLLHD